MEDTIYNFTRLFYNAKSIFDEKFNSHDNTYEESCTNFISDNDLDERFYKISCLKCMTYIKYLEDENFVAQKNNSVLTVAQALLYLYFWLKDNEFSTKNYNKITLDIYKNLLKSYDQVDRSNMHTTYYTKIKDDEIDTLKLIYDLYYKFDKLIHAQKCQGNNCVCAQECFDLYTQSINHCNNDVNAYYCNELENFRQAYHAYMNNNNTCHAKYKYLPPAIKSNIAVISVSIVITLITLILFLYKFTPIGSYLRTRIISKKKKFDNLSKEIHHISHPSELSYANSKNMYNVTYHSMEHP